MPRMQAPIIFLSKSKEYGMKVTGARNRSHSTNRMPKTKLKTKKQIMSGLFHPLGWYKYKLKGKRKRARHAVSNKRPTMLNSRR